MVFKLQNHFMALLLSSLAVHTCACLYWMSCTSAVPVRQTWHLSITISDLTNHRKNDIEVAEDRSVHTPVIFFPQKRTLFGDGVEIDAMDDDDDVFRPMNVIQVPWSVITHTRTQSINRSNFISSNVNTWSSSPLYALHIEPVDSSFSYCNRVAVSETIVFINFFFKPHILTSTYLSGLVNWRLIGS